ncbi:MAG: hypothetical protein EXR99_06910 [Gemmataceae bacterium]|nr:hypothetical protein [Gemmataceae bacterium]
MAPQDSPAKKLESLFREFVGEAIPPLFPVSPQEMPEPFKNLLDHEDHMTVTMEANYGELMEIQVLKESQGANTYARMLRLNGEKTKRTVLFGAMRVRLDFLPQLVRQEILAKKTPLGRILIKHHVMRKLELVQLLKLELGEEQRHWFGSIPPGPIYGRVAIIHCHGLPAIELFEVAAPLGPDPSA